jgi:hypothetical protein
LEQSGVDLKSKAGHQLSIMTVAGCGKTRKYVKPRLVFERGEESAFSLAFLQKADPSPANDSGSE